MDAARNHRYPSHRAGR